MHILSVSGSMSKRNSGSVLDVWQRKQAGSTRIGSRRGCTVVPTRAKQAQVSVSLGLASSTVDYREDEYSTETELWLAQEMYSMTRNTYEGSIVGISGTGQFISRLSMETQVGIFSRMHGKQYTLEQARYVLEGHRAGQTMEMRVNLIFGDMKAIARAYTDACLDRRDGEREQSRDDEGTLYKCSRMWEVRNYSELTDEDLLTLSHGYDPDCADFRPVSGYHLEARILAEVAGRLLNP